MAEEIEEELVPIVEGEDTTPPADADGDEQDDHDEDEGDEDERLATSEEDSDAEISSSRKRRITRRERTRAKRDETARELEMLRQQNRDLATRLGAVEGHTLQTNEQQIAQRHAAVLEDIRQAEAIFAKATEEGQGEHAMQAMRIRDAAKAEASRLEAAHAQVKQVRETPQVDQRTVSHAQEWMKDNPWYDPTGADPTSALTKKIDTQLASEGYDPAHRGYWEELTSRVTEALKPTTSRRAAPANGDEPAPRTARRSAPPMGTTREHASPATRRSEIRVTAERKAAMVEAGVWDDPVRRQRVLKEYREYDKASAR